MRLFTIIDPDVPELCEENLNIISLIDHMDFAPEELEAVFKLRVGACLVLDKHIQIRRTA